MQQEALEILQEHEQKDLLRFVTAGSVDDGKSTLIGRLLYESKGIYEDQLAGVRSASGRRGSAQEDLDLSLVTDGLKAEREQGITIDVAYRYFSTPNRKFIIADTPGHEQYTRNTATGASTANLAIVLIDAVNGVLTQSKRHAFIASLLAIPHLVVTVNKMDLVDYSEKVFEEIVEEFSSFAAKLEIRDVTFIPISALKGDNVTGRSGRMPWYEGPTLLSHLENVHIASDRNFIDLRFPVQYVSRPSSQFRGYIGTVASGMIRPGDEVMALPSGRKSRVRQVIGPEGAEMEEAFPPQPVTVTLTDEIDVSRGDMLVHVHNVPHLDRECEAMIIWMAEEPMKPGKQYLAKHTTRQVPAMISDLRFRMDVNTLHRQQATELQLNEIGRCTVELARPIAYDPYQKSRSTGSFILIDRLTNNTVAAGVILDREQNKLHTEPSQRVRRPRSTHVQPRRSDVTAAQRRERLSQTPATIWLTGLTGSGKTTIAYALEKRLFEEGYLASVLDGENVRLGVNKDLGFTAEERSENLRRSAEIARLLNGTGLISICAFLSPTEEDREQVREILGAERFLEVYLDAPLEVCRQRAPRGLYDKAEAGEVPMFSGVTAPYEPPVDADLTLPTDELDVQACVDRILELMRSKGLLER